MTALLSIAALVVAILAWRRDNPVHALAERIQVLEQQIAILRRHLPERAQPQRADAAPPLASDEPAAPEPQEAAGLGLGLPRPAEAAPADELRPVPAAAPAKPSRRVAPRPPAAPAIDWERWLGVRGAAVLGGIVLALSGLYLFRYSIEHDLISPTARVGLGLFAGSASLAAAEWKLRERYAPTADALAGAGFAILYASLWAARARYGLIGSGTAFVAMACVTAACTWLSGIRGSLLIAALGLAGGFATPLLVASQAQHPLGLFGYLLLLDLGMLLLGQRRGWPALGLASLVATTFYQALWIGWRMGPERVSLGLAILAAFALVFARVGGGEGDRRERSLTQAAAVLFPFAFTLYLAASVHFGVHLWRVALLLGVLSAAACIVARREAAPWLATAAAAGSVAVVAAWGVQRILDPSLAFELGAIACGLAAVFHVFAERDPARAGLPALVAGLGFLALLVLGVDRAAPFVLWPWLAGWLVLGALGIRQGTFPGRGWIQIAVAVGVAVGFTRVAARVGVPGPTGLVLSAFAVAVLFQGASIVQRGPSREAGGHAAASFALLAATPLLVPRFLREVSLTVLLDAALVHGLLAAMVARRLGTGVWTLVAVAVTAGIQLFWTTEHAHQGLGAPALLGAFGLQLASALLFAAWPFLAGNPYARDPAACWAAALALPVWFPSLRALFVLRFGDDAIGLLPLGLGAVALAAAAFVRARWPLSDPARRRMLVWQVAVALGFLTVAVPLQLEHEWITVAWALEGIALVWLWRRVDHPGLKALALALFAAVTVRLVANPAVLGYHGRGWPVFNWLLYTYLVPVGSLLAASRWLAPLELPRLRPFERPLYPRAIPLGAITTGIAGLVVLFVWLNLTIFDAFGEIRELQLAFARKPLRDLTLSLAWAVYGLALLAVGVWRRLQPLRWASLVLVVLTVGKVFLYDLGELRDLYRVASLFGLAVSLGAVSLGYQRFVFRADAEPAHRPPES